jgi:excisionase family DNA binding protein
MLVMSVEEVADALGCKRRKVFELLADGTLERAPRYGREIRIYTETVRKALLPRTEKKRRQVSSPGAPALITYNDLKGLKEKHGL